MSVANITLLGNVGREPETKHTSTGKMNVVFSMAVSKKRGTEETTNWYRVTCWGKLAETMDGLAQGGALTKGAKVLVIGRLEARDYTAADGTPKYSLDVDANDVQLVGGRGKQAEEEPLPF